MSEIEQLRKVAQAATPGPWEGSYDDSGRPFWIVNTARTGDQVASHDVGQPWDYDERHGKEGADAAHIATFDPPTVLSLLDRLEAADAALGRVRELAEKWQDVLSECKASDPRWILDRSVTTLETAMAELRAALNGGTE